MQPKQLAEVNLEALNIYAGKKLKIWKLILLLKRLKNKNKKKTILKENESIKMKIQFIKI